ncbi:MAG: IclR family transcriptional regulator [Frankia sp.]
MRKSVPGSGTSRALSILGCFSEATPKLTLTEASQRTGLPLTSTHRQIGELVSWGALERGEDGRYQIGLRVWEIGSLAPRRLGLREAALPFMEDLYEVTHENIQIAVLDGLDVVYVERIAGRRAVHVVTRAGSRLPAQATAVGLVLLAHSDQAQIDAALAAPMKAYTEHTVTDPRHLRKALTEVRRQGYAISDRQIENVSISVAAPIYDANRVVTAALSIVVSASRGKARHYLPAVLASARGVSRALGAVY